MTYKEDFESERKDRESVHTRIADMETRYRHQLEALGEELQKVTDEAKRQRETVARKDNQLQQQRQQMTAQLHQKEGELASAAQRIQALEVHVGTLHSLPMLYGIYICMYIHVPSESLIHEVFNLHRRR